MSRRPRAAVVVPVYKPDLAPTERRSLRQLVRVLGRHPLVFMTFEGLALDAYRAEIPPDADFRVMTFPKACFAGTYTYSQLLLTADFYRRFKAWDYILIHQLDALVFKDELDHWCAQGYDYIGAPWVGTAFQEPVYRSLFASSNPLIRMVKRVVDFNGGKKLDVGNGGFSLRRVRTFTRIARWLPYLSPHRLSVGFNEDLIWSILVPKYFRSFRIPPVSTAMRFSVETSPEACLDSLGDVPFGCHAWPSRAPDFWQEVMERHGVPAG